MATTVYNPPVSPNVDMNFKSNYTPQVSPNVNLDLGSADDGGLSGGGSFSPSGFMMFFPMG